MASVFGRLQYNFDNSKFGDAIEITDKAKNALNNSPIVLKTWQVNELADGNISTGDYYKNPVLNVTNQLWANVNTLISVVNSVLYQDYDYPSSAANAANLISSTSNLNLQIINFIRHTSNVCGLNTSRGQSTEGTDELTEYPDYDKAVSLGQQLLLVTNKTDSVANSTPLLGSMTSLFISDEIIANTINLISDTATFNTTLRIGGLYSNTLSNITTSAIISIITNVEKANSLLYVRRTHDWNFYRNGREIINDYNKVSKFGRVGGTQTYLINNMIGTDKYKEYLAANT